MMRYVSAPDRHTHTHDGVSQAEHNRSARSALMAGTPCARRVYCGCERPSTQTYRAVAKQFQRDFVQTTNRKYIFDFGERLCPVKIESIFCEKNTLSHIGPVDKLSLCTTLQTVSYVCCCLCCAHARFLIIALRLNYSPTGGGRGGLQQTTCRIKIPLARALNCDGDADARPFC